MKKTARIIGTGSYLPKRLVTNEILETMVKNFDIERAGMPFVLWAETMTGIKERYYVEDESAETMGAYAAKKAIEAAGITSEDLDFIIVSSFTPSQDVPNLACSITHLIGARDIGGFPLNTACAGFIYGLSIAYSLIGMEIYQRILVVATEVLSKVTNYSDPKTAVLFGDGAGAVVLEASENGGISSFPYLSSEYSRHFELNNPNMADARGILTVEEKEYIRRCYIKMPGGPRVLRKAINSMADAALRALEQSSCRLEEIDYIIPHQANKRITDGLIEKLNVSPAKVCTTIEKFGNTSGASVAITLDKLAGGEIEDHCLKKGDKIVLTAVGAGYTFGALVLEY